MKRGWSDPPGGVTGSVLVSLLPVDPVPFHLIPDGHPGDPQDFRSHALVAAGLLKGFERAVTAVFGSSNTRYIKRLHSRVAAINELGLAPE